MPLSPGMPLAPCVNCLVLGVSAHPGDHDVLFVAEDEMHAPVAVEAPLSYPVIGTRIGSHADAASLTPAVTELFESTIKTLLHLTAKRLVPPLAAARDSDLEPCHQPIRSALRGLRSDLHGIAGQSVSQALACARLLERSPIGRLAQQLREAALVLGQSTQPRQALLELLNAREPHTPRRAVRDDI